MQRIKAIWASHGRLALAVLLVVTVGFGVGRAIRTWGNDHAEEAATEAGRVMVDLDLSANATAPTPVPTDKLHETEPEDLPDEQNDLRIDVVDRTTGGSGPVRVLIYHTHTYEAYEPTPDATYKPTERWRTKDERYNVVRLGAELAQILRTDYGMEVVHDKGVYEPPVLSTAYTRSLAGIDAYTARGETFDLYIDLHRNAYNDSMKNTNVVTVGGLPVARLMMLIGKGTGASGNGFEQKPNWPENLKLAEFLTTSLNAQMDRLCYPVTIKTGRFNQHVSEHAVLVEVGNNMNTLAEVLRAIPYLAKAIHEAVTETF